MFRYFSKQYSTVVKPKLDHTLSSICDRHLITIDHRNPIGCSTILQASRVSGCNVIVIKGRGHGKFILSLLCKYH